MYIMDKEQTAVLKYVQHSKEEMMRLTTNGKMLKSKILGMKLYN